MTSGPEWLDPIGSEPVDRQAGSVQAALLTTYDPPDAALLVEDLLPRWFRLDREMSSDDAANRFFHAELEAELQRRRGKIAIFSSVAVLGPDSQHWIWSHVARHFVGARGAVVQHAKVWLLHRVDDKGAERLDIRVSSTNLTRSAIREQVQAGFQCLTPVGPRVSRAELNTWGALIPFLRELGSHAGPSGMAAIDPWLRLLARCRCPEDVTFVASVPGTHKGDDWGVRALGRALRLTSRAEVDILVPTVGRWTKHQIISWAKAIGTRPNLVGLAWVPKGHPWAKHWEIPAVVVTALKRCGTCILALADGEGDGRPRLHHRFGKYDERWPHAKVYWFAHGVSPRVLVTSANWSPSAWGVSTAKNYLHIRNFELGVLLKARKRPLRTLREMTAPPATVVLAHDVDGTAPWGHATFDGRRLVVMIAKDEVAPDQIVTIDPDGHRLKLKVRWRLVDGLLQASLKRAWKTLPSCIVLLLRGVDNWLSVQDLRDADASQERPLSRPPGMNDDELKRLRATLLEERYGGKLVDDELPTGGKVPDNGKPPGPVVGDYSVWLLDEARRVLGVVDTWARAIAGSKSTDLRVAIDRDGRQLLRLWRDEISKGSRRAGALNVACDELEARLRSRQ